MSVIIKGMEMPRTCYDCKLRRRNGLELICPVLERSYKIADTQVLFVREKDCPLIEVPEPHGRLGDLDELYDHLNEWYLTHEHGFFGNEKIYIRAMRLGVKDAPTIIPASEEG